METQQQYDRTIRRLELQSQLSVVATAVGAEYGFDDPTAVRLRAEAEALGIRANEVAGPGDGGCAAGSPRFSGVGGHAAVTELATPVTR